MTSNDLKKRARAIQQANPGMKYTEALRQAKAAKGAADPQDSPGRKAIKGYLSTGHLDPVSDFNLAEYEPKQGENTVDLSTTPSGALNPFRKGASNQGASNSTPRGVYVGEAISGTGAGPVFVDVVVPNGNGTGSADQYRWAGRCGTEEQAVAAWESLGSPGDRDLFVNMLMRLEPDQFIFSNPSRGQTQIIKVDAENLAQMMGRKSLGE